MTENKQKRPPNRKKALHETVVSAIEKTNKIQIDKSRGENHLKASRWLAEHKLRFPLMKKSCADPIHQRKAKKSSATQSRPTGPSRELTQSQLAQKKNEKKGRSTHC